eukprot:1157903-Pelagomonas_calceolata.AAC.7
MTGLRFSRLLQIKSSTVRISILAESTIILYSSARPPALTSLLAWRSKYKASTAMEKVRHPQAYASKKIELVPNPCHQDVHCGSQTTLTQESDDPAFLTRKNRQIAVHV